MSHKNKYHACSCTATGNSSRSQCHRHSQLFMLNISDRFKIIPWFKCNYQNKKRKIVLQSEVQTAAGCSSDDREAAAAGESTLLLCIRPTGGGEEGRQRSGGGIRAAPCRRCWHETLCCGILLTPPDGQQSCTAMSYISQNSFAWPPDSMSPVTVKLFY